MAWTPVNAIIDAEEQACATFLIDFRILNIDSFGIDRDLIWMRLARNAVDTETSLTAVGSVGVEWLDFSLASSAWNDQRLHDHDQHYRDRHGPQRVHRVLLQGTRGIVPVLPRRKSRG